MLCKKKRVMCHEMKKLHGLKVIRYADCMIYLNEYLSMLPREKASYNFFEMELNAILLKRMPKIWNRQAYVQGFYCETITKEICKHVWTHGNNRIYLWRCCRFFYKTLLRQIPTVLVTAGKWEEKLPNKIITTIWVRELESTEKVMYIICRIYPN